MFFLESVADANIVSLFTGKATQLADIVVPKLLTLCLSCQFNKLHADMTLVVVRFKSPECR